MTRPLTQLQSTLISMQDAGYRDFQRKLMPTVDRAAVIGVRTPALRKLAKAFAASPEAETFLAALPHRYYEENNLHAYLINGMRDYEKTIAALDAFLPYVDNWATCDGLRPNVFARHLPRLSEKIPAWLSSGHVYTVRFGIEMLMSFYLDGAFEKRYLDWVAAVHSDEYYVNMMIAWYFATALAKQYDSAVPYLESGALDCWTHNKTVQKAIESYRITDEQKAYLRSLRRK